MQQDLKEILARKVGKNILGGCYLCLIVRVVQVLYDYRQAWTTRVVCDTKMGVTNYENLNFCFT